MNRVICGNNIDVLRTFEDNSIDSCITDPPYGMGMEAWDYSVPTKEFWIEVERVLKPGAFVLSFCSPQLYHRMACAVEDAGFTIRDQIMWMITTKMPKKNYLKQAHEPIVVAQKKFKGSIKDNVSQWGVGEIDVTNTRVPWDGKPPKGWIKGGSRRRAFGKEVLSALREKQICELVVSFGKDYVDSITDILLDEWINEEKYPEDLKIVFNQALKVVKKDRSKFYKGFEKLLKDRTEDANPSGRYPSNIIGEVNKQHQKYFYAPRVSRTERGEYNNHPTPKPISLMSYLIKVYCPEGGIVLDPFTGSSSTGLGAAAENRSFIGIDLESEYIEISRKRFNDREIEVSIENI